MSQGQHGRDLISDLPVEILYNIFSNLNARSAGICQATGLHYLEPLQFTRTVPRRTYPHPFLQLALCSKRHEEVVESHCRSLLLHHKALTKFNGKPLNKKTRAISHRGLWRHFSRKKCAFCGKATVRSAIFNCLILCCQACDKKEWPEKITRSKAVTQYKLDLEDLINVSDNHINAWGTLSGPHNGVWPGAQVRPLEAWPDSGLMTLRHAVYVCSGVDTTMFFENEVRERASVMRGDCLVGSAVALSLRKSVADPGLKGVKPIRKRRCSDNSYEGSIEDSPIARRTNAGSSKTRAIEIESN